MIKRNLNYLNETVKFPKKENETYEIIDTQPLADDPYTYDDYWGDTYSSFNGLSNGSLFYYYLNDQLIKTLVNTDEKRRMMALIPPVDAVQSVLYQPYLEGEDLSLVLTTFDEQRMPLPNIKETSFFIPPYMVRLKNIIKETKQVGAFLRYTKKPDNVSGDRNYNMESKLQMFPYTYGMLADGIMDPMTFKYEYIENGSNLAKVMLYQPLTNQGTYSLVIDKYKGDQLGTLEGNISNSNFNLPITSNAYVNFMSSNQAQNKLQMFNATLGAAKGVVSAGASIASGNIAGAVSGAGGIVSGAQQIAGVMAQRKDLQNTPNTMKNSGSDIMFKRVFNNGYLTHYRFDITETYKRQLGDYFSLYGYKQNKVFKPDLRSRYYYNYIKTVGANLKTQGIPKEHVDMLKDIFDGGVTVWHLDRNGVVINDYKKDNKEMNL